jgi:outer membrane lipoprotein-sorting protein
MRYPMAKYDEKEILRGLETISKIKPSSEATHRAMERVRETLADKQAKRGRSNPRIWMIVIQSRIIKFAAAAVIIIAIVIGISQFGGTTAEAGVCWAEVGKKVEQIEMFICRGQRRPVETVKEKTAEIHWTEYYSSKHGIRWDMYRKDKRIRITYMIPEENVVIDVLLSKKAYTRGLLSEEQITEYLEYYDPKKMIKKLLSSEYTRLPRKTINGVEVEGIEGVLALEAQWAESSVIRFWVDVETELPVLIEWKRVTAGGKILRMKTIIDEFQWDVKLESSVFEPNIPADYILMAEVDLSDNEENAVYGLQMFAQISGGRYPSSLTLLTATKEARKACEQNKDQSEDELDREDWEQVYSIQASCCFYGRLVVEDKDVAYYGRTVTAKDTDKVLLRWKISDGQYRVIFGDLTVENVTAERLAELEETQ